MIVPDPPWLPVFPGSTGLVLQERWAAVDARLGDRFTGHLASWRDDWIEFWRHTGSSETGGAQETACQAARFRLGFGNRRGGLYEWPVLPATETNSSGVYTGGGVYHSLDELDEKGGEA